VCRHALPQHLTAMSPELNIYHSPAELFRASAELFIKLANDAIHAKGSFTVALSGGSTPKSMHSLLASEFASAVAWKKVFFFWGDERHVPPDHPDSNYRMAQETLLSKVPVDPAKVFRPHSENPDANAAAIEYEQTITTAFGVQDREIPRFDLIFLGLGPDGHTASLFPQSAALREHSRLVAANWVEKFHTYRITFTLPLINNAANVAFLVAGKDKASAVQSVFDPDTSGQDFPAKLVNPQYGRLVWMLTEDAAAPIAERIAGANVRNSQR
jgi:6-phosphogluconolactonase